MIREKLTKVYKLLNLKAEHVYFNKLLFNPTAHPIELVEIPEYNPITFNEEKGIYVKRISRKQFYIADNREDIEFYFYLMGFTEVDLQR